MTDGARRFAGANRPAADARPDRSLERALERDGVHPVAGVDEVGRGPLSGPVVAAAVILPEGAIPEGIDDSKRVSPRRRALLAKAIRETCAVAVSIVDVTMIDRINILQAAMLAMRRAVEGLQFRPAHILVDGNRLPEGLAMPATAVVKGDRKSLSIGAASIVAKEERDRLMRELSGDFPQYGWERNAGYATRDHLGALREFGPTPHHRMSFAPVREAAAA